MRLCIDASNLRAGGGVTHLRELLRCARPHDHGFEAVFVWAPRATLERLEQRPWLVPRTAPVLERNYLRRALWQRFSLGGCARRDGCDLLFAPGGAFATPFRPVVTMSRNMLPFEPAEARRFGMSAMRIKMLLLRWTNARSLRRADGVIFLTRYARDAILAQIGPLSGRVAIVPHGVDARFAAAAREHRPLQACTASAPLRLVYVSTIDVYKHQVEVAHAVASLRARGLPIALDFVGPAYPPALAGLRRVLDEIDPASSFLRYIGPVAHERLNETYAQADAAVFASSCENMPNTLLEKMAAGLPIACSDRGPMPEVLGDAGVYFDPNSAPSIEAALRRLAESAQLRAGIAEAARRRAEPYTWQRCADETFALLSAVGHADQARTA